MNNKYLKIFLCTVLLAASACRKAETAEETIKNSDITSDLARSDEHLDITWDLIRMAEHSPEIKALLEKAISQAHAANPNPDTNPVDSLESYYAFVDRVVRGMPWEIEPAGNHDSLYDQIDQSMGCLYFIADQPLEELSGYGYYHNSLLYHEPFRSWWIEMLGKNGAFLNTEESWNDKYYQTALANPDFQLAGDLYEDPSNWKSFNDFFARKLSDPAKRPIAAADDPSVIVSPADSEPQGFWQIDEDSRVQVDFAEEEGISIKTGTLTDVSVLLKGSAYADAFAGGTLTHTFLDVNDYHRYHFPADGTVKEVFMIPQDDAPGGVIIWNQKLGKYKEYYSQYFGWQSIETRGVIILELDSGGLAAIVPVGMCQVSSVNFESNITPGLKVKKGDPMGYFLFGGSDIIMVFSKDAGFEMTTPAGQHIDMGTRYGQLSK